MLPRDAEVQVALTYMRLLAMVTYSEGAGAEGDGAGDKGVSGQQWSVSSSGSSSIGTAVSLSLRDRLEAVRALIVRLLLGGHADGSTRKAGTVSTTVTSSSGSGLPSETLHEWFLKLRAIPRLAILRSALLVLDPSVDFNAPFAHFLPTQETTSASIAEKLPFLQVVVDKYILPATVDSEVTLRVSALAALQCAVEIAQKCVSRRSKESEKEGALLAAHISAPNSSVVAAVSSASSSVASEGFFPPLEPSFCCTLVKVILQHWEYADQRVLEHVPVIFEGALAYLLSLETLQGGGRDGDDKASEGSITSASASDAAAPLSNLSPPALNIASILSQILHQILARPLSSHGR